VDTCLKDLRLAPVCLVGRFRSAFAGSLTGVPFFFEPQGSPRRCVQNICLRGDVFKIRMQPSPPPHPRCRRPLLRPARPKSAGCLVIHHIAPFGAMASWAPLPGAPTGSCVNGSRRSTVNNERSRSLQGPFRCSATSPLGGRSPVC
jgi:hypothetical protein